MDTNVVETRPAMSDAEWEARVELAACYRLLAHYGMTDLIFTHTTMRVPGTEDQFLINPYGLMWEEITASSLVKIDLHGNIVGPSAYKVNRAGFVIHSAVHMARHDAVCVIHTHTRAGMAVAALECGLLPINQMSMSFEGILRYHDYEGIALDMDERERLVHDLGDGRAMILRNHGLLTVGRSIGEALNLMYVLDQSCALQIAAQSAGVPLTMPGDAVRARVAAQNKEVLEDDGDLALVWAAMRRLADRIDPSYRQ